MRIVSVRLDEASDTALRRICDRSGLTQTEAIKRGIERLAGEAAVAPAALARQLGLIGAFDSGDGTLARDHSERLREKLRGRHQRPEEQPGPGARRRG